MSSWTAFEKSQIRGVWPLKRQYGNPAVTAQLNQAEHWTKKVHHYMKKKPQPIIAGSVGARILRVEGPRGGRAKKWGGTIKKIKYAKLRHFSFHGLFCILQKLEYFWNGTDTTCISKFWTYFLPQFLHWASSVAK